MPHDAAHMSPMADKKLGGLIARMGARTQGEVPSAHLKAGQITSGGRGQAQGVPRVEHVSGKGLHNDMGAETAESNHG